MTKRLFTSVMTGLMLLTMLCLSFAMVAHSADVTLAWDANDPAPEGYRIFVRPELGAYDYSAPAWQGTETTGQVTELVEGQGYAFVVRAYAGEFESADSNEVVYAIPEPTQTIVYPRQVKELVIRFE